jgi:acetyl-CoA acetyltransferase
MAHPLYRGAAIVGVDESDQIGVVPNKSPLQLHAEAAMNALADAGIDKSEVDGIATAGVSTLQIAEYLGITPKYTDGTAVGGSSFVIHVGHALEAISDGRASVVLITHGQAHLRGWNENRNKNQPRGAGAPDPSNIAAQYEAPYGVIGAPYAYSLACMRHMAQYGTTKEQLAEIAVQTRQWAMKNPKAMMRDPITVEDVLNSRMISYPFNLLDCCLVTDAGGACVVVSPERARDLRKKPVWVLGIGEAHDHSMISQMPDLTRTPAQYSGPAAMGMAGVTHDDIDLCMIYDSFTYTVLVTLESLGFCKPGEGGAFVSGGRLGPGGALPTNTNGGGLSYTHPGMYGMFLLLEATRQLRGECGERQVQDCKVALVNGTGGSLSSTGTLILAAD